MKFTKELLEKAKKAKSAEELQNMAKAENAEITKEEAEKYFAELHKNGEISDEELDNVSGGCGNPEPKTEWGESGVWSKKEDVIFDFALNTRVLVYITPSTSGKGTIIDRRTDCDDYGWYPSYLVKHDDASVANCWYAQANVGKLL